MSELYRQPSGQPPDLEEDSELDSDASNQQGRRRTKRKKPYAWNSNIDAVAIVRRMRLQHSRLRQFGGKQAAYQLFLRQCMTHNRNLPPGTEPISLEMMCEKTFCSKFNAQDVVGCVARQAARAEQPGNGGGDEAGVSGGGGGSGAGYMAQEQQQQRQEVGETQVVCCQASTAWAGSCHFDEVHQLNLTQLCSLARTWLGLGTLHGGA
jgi:hypothetical protein